MTDEYMPTFADRMDDKRERMRFEAACAAMQGFCASNEKEWDAKDCVEHADDLLAALYPEVKRD